MVTTTMETIRIRVEFEDRHILNKSQRLQGLKRSWLLLNPQHLRTISDLSVHLLHHFNLHRSCPNGLLLSMEGFVLPSFESTCILKDKEIICVKKKRDKLSVEAGNVTKLLEEGEIVEKQPVDNTVVPLLANEEFEKETGGYQSESEEDEDGQSEATSPLEDSSDDHVVSKKRKACTELRSPKKKKHRVEAPNGLEDDGQTEQTENHHVDGPRPKKRNREEKESDVKSKPTSSSSPAAAEISTKKIGSSSTLKRSEQLQENGQEVENVTPLSGETKKLPSRSARRKKAKRRWLQEICKIAKKNPRWMKEAAKDDEKVVGGHQKRNQRWKTESAKTDKNKKKWNWKTESAKADENEVAGQPKGLLHWKQLPEKNVHKNMAVNEEPNQDGGLQTALVPIVVRPGHIRFEPLENDEDAQQIEVSKETFQWNGITSKKKGQKWGTEKSSWGTEKSSFARRNDTDGFKKENSKQLTTVKEVPAIGPIEFDKLPLLCGPPQEGDVIAYRLIELSSSWTPEISSFRVGQIFSYCPESSKILLMPVPDHPIVSEKEDEGTPDNALYGEDGSLETEFSSLVDPRIIKQNNSDTAKVVSGVDQAAQKDATSNVVPSSNGNKTPVSTPGKEVNLWDQLSETLNAKKAELSEENGWTKESSGRNRWSFRALRGSALGPTMAMLRSNNKI